MAFLKARGNEILKARYFKGFTLYTNHILLVHWTFAPGVFFKISWMTDIPLKFLAVLSFFLWWSFRDQLWKIPEVLTVCVRHVYSCVKKSKAIPPTSAAFLGRLWSPLYAPKSAHWHHTAEEDTSLPISTPSKLNDDHIEDVLQEQKKKRERERERTSAVIRGVPFQLLTLTKRGRKSAASNSRGWLLIT